MHYISMGKGLEKKIEDKILSSAMAGDWLLLENLNLVLDWIPRLEDLLAKMHEETVTVSTRFRLWLSSIPLPNFPSDLLFMSIKI